jgi:SAM-dependent methyltransferase
VRSGRRRPYDDAYFERMDASVARSAAVIAPTLLELTQATSAVDIGCGRGTWLAALRDHGVERLRGVDGSDVGQEKLKIDQKDFFVADLEKPLSLTHEYDLALCLEVVEHLSAKAGRRLIGTLTQAAPFVLFSSAVPGQGGVGHINEQWPQYWEALFSTQGFVRLDPFRRLIAYDLRVKWWYRQNLVLYVARREVDSSAVLGAEESFAREVGQEWIHMSTLAHYVDETSFKKLALRLPFALRHGIARRVRRLRSAADSS